MSALPHQAFDSQNSNDRADDAIRIFIADDSLEIRTGLRELFRRGRKFEVVGECADGSEAVWQATSLRPQVMLIKAGLTGADGANVIETIKELMPECKLIAMVDPARDSDIYASIAAGADGCCIRKLSIDDLKVAIRSVASGGFWYDPAVRRRLAEACAGELKVSQQPKSQEREAQSALERLAMPVGPTFEEEVPRLFVYYRPQWYHQRKLVTALHWVMVAIFVVLVMLCTGPLVKAVLDHASFNRYQTSTNSVDFAGGPTAPIPGIAYNLFELQCRTWGRYRGTACFNL